MHFRICALIAGLVLASASLPIAAQTNYPLEKPINIIVPFAAGSGTDVLARTLSAAMERSELHR